MFNLPDDCTADQALDLIREYDQAEQARLLAEYEPYEPSESDRSWSASEELADWGEFTAWAMHAERTNPIVDRDILVATGSVG